MILVNAVKGTQTLAVKQGGNWTNLTHVPTGEVRAFCHAHGLRLLHEGWCG